VAAAGWGVGLAWMRLVSTAWLMWDEPWRYTVCSTLSTVLRTAALCGLVAVGTRPEVAVAVAGLMSAIAAVAVRPHVRGVPRGGDEGPRLLGLSLAASSLAVGALQGLDKVLLPLVTSAHEAGRYAAMSNLSAYSLGAFFSILSATVFTPLLRLWEADEHAAVLRRLRSAMTVTLGLSALVASLVLLCGAPALVGPDYMDVSVLAALLVGTGLLTCAQFTAFLYQFRLATTALQVRSWLAAGVTIPLLLVGGRVAGEDGAAAAMVAGLAVYALGLQFRSGMGVASTVATAPVVALGLAAVSGADRILVGVGGLAVACLLLALILRKPLRAVRSRRRPLARETEAEQSCS
jgi:hypothetical protein